MNIKKVMTLGMFALTLLIVPTLGFCRSGNGKKNTVCENRTEAKPLGSDECFSTKVLGWSKNRNEEYINSFSTIYDKRAAVKDVHDAVVAQLSSAGLDQGRLVDMLDAFSLTQDSVIKSLILENSRIILGYNPGEAGCVQEVNEAMYVALKKIEAIVSTLTNPNYYPMIDFGHGLKTRVTSFENGAWRFYSKV